MTKDYLERAFQAYTKANPDAFTTSPGAFTKSWVTGGMEGGSYRGTRNYAVSPENEPSFDSLDSFLLSLTPPVTFAQYRDILSKATRAEVREDDYYNNYTIKTVVTIPFSAVLSVLAQVPSNPTR